MDNVSDSDTTGAGAVLAGVPGVACWPVVAAVETELITQEASIFVGVHTSEKIKKPKIDKTPQQVAKQETLRELEKRTPEEWEKLIEGIVNLEVRTRVACMVWWDYFSFREVAEKWPHLDKYLALAFPAGQTAEINPSVTEIVRALESIGYANGLATSRACKVDDVVEADDDEEI
jgi:hypothetical protein